MNLDTTKENNLKIENVDLNSVEELETAIAPGGVGVFCGCVGTWGIVCG